VFSRRHPAQAYLNRLRCHARSRGIAFTLTLEELLEVCKDFNFQQYDTPQGDRLSVDRIDARLGYMRGNIQVMTVRENTVKQRRHDYGYGWQERCRVIDRLIKVAESDDHDDLPEEC
jgi:hypothetical protein